MTGLLSQVVSFLLLAIGKLGYLGIFFGMVLESSFFPFPSEIILIPAGALISQGKMNFFYVFSLALLGSVAGALANYFIALSLGRRTVEKLVSRYGKIFFISRAELDKTDKYFEHHGQITTFVGRLLPGIRQLISLPAGFSKMNLARFCIFTAAGAGFWSLILIYAGWLADKNHVWLSQHPVALAIILVAICAAIVFAYIMFLRKKRRSN